MTNPVTALLLVATWVSFLWFRDMRTARTVAYLIAATVVYLAADLAPDPWPLLLRLIVAASVLALHLRFSHLPIRALTRSPQVLGRIRRHKQADDFRLRRIREVSGARTVGSEPGQGAS